MLQNVIDHWAGIATVLLGISEGLALMPFIKSNSILQAIVNGAISLLKKKDA